MYTSSHFFSRHDIKHSFARLLCPFRSQFPCLYYFSFTPCLSALSLLIHSSLPQMRQSDPGLAISSCSNLCPFPNTWFAHFMNWNVSMAGVPLCICPVRHSTLSTSSALMTVKTGGICRWAHTDELQIIMPRSSHTFSQSFCLSGVHTRSVWLVKGLDLSWSFTIVILTVRFQPVL